VIGVRIALAAPRKSVRWMVLKRLQAEYAVFQFPVKRVIRQLDAIHGDAGQRMES
jgi:hypothetical protein